MKKSTLIISFVIFFMGLAMFLAQPNSAKSLVRDTFVINYIYYVEGGDPETNLLWMTKVSHSGKVKTERRTVKGVEIEPKYTEYTETLWRKCQQPKFLAIDADSGEVREKTTMLGLETYIWREEANGIVVTRWFSPRTGPVPLKWRIDSPGQKTKIIEATSIDFRDVTENEVE